MTVHQSHARYDLIDFDRIALLTDQNRTRQYPRATYRLQFHAGFKLRDASAIVPYLARLGISHLYASPIFSAVPGSQHGYDVVDFNALNPELGSDQDFRDLTEALNAHNMKLMLDFVPNHMGISCGRNPWWQDVLENGQTSPYLDFFDIDWEPIKIELGNKVLLPILGEHYGVTLENGEFSLRYQNGEFTVWYYDTPLPIAPPTYDRLLNHARERLISLPADDLDGMELESLAVGFARLPGQDERDPELIAERQREQAVNKRRLARLTDQSTEIEAAIQAVVSEFNGTTGNQHSFDALDALLEAQSYRLAFWRVATEEINYRRFFAINDLAAIRQEVPTVFDATHALLLSWIGTGEVDAVRIDHPDGLWNPAEYVRNLQRESFLARYLHGQTAGEDHPALVSQLRDWWEREWSATPASPALRPIHLVLEKIVGHSEVIPESWPIDGTVGYEFAAEMTGLAVDRRSEAPINRTWTGFTDQIQSFSDLAYEKKKLMLRIALASEFSVLARVLDKITEHGRRTRDFTLHGLRDALRECIACFPIYRTYLEEGKPTSESDRAAIEMAIAEAKRRNPYPDVSILDFILGVLLNDESSQFTDEERVDRTRFRMKFQQLTSPVMAKGVEDTAFYIFNRLTSLNEVGGEPVHFGERTRDIHRRMGYRADVWPGMLLTSSTHDTKRSEDVRARINVVSEVPREWRSVLNRWSRLNRRFRVRTANGWAPDRNDEVLFYQTLIGTWPIDGARPDQTYRDRIAAYLEKATREAQVRTNWTNPNLEYDQALRTFVLNTLDAELSADFLMDISQTVESWLPTGLLNGLIQQAIKLTSPGIPDLYQGTESWDFSLVDPDNRRPVDFELRNDSIAELISREPTPDVLADLWANRADGRIKQYLTYRILEYRSRAPELFMLGDYRPLRVTGLSASHIFAFARTSGFRQMIVVAPRLIHRKPGSGTTAGFHPSAWSETVLVTGKQVLTGSWRDLLTNEVQTIDAGHQIHIGELLKNSPVAILVREETP